MRSALQRWIRRATEWIDARSLRERASLLAAVLAVAIAAWTVFLMDPRSARIAETSTEVQKIEQQVRQLEARGQEILEAHVHNENDALRERREELRGQIDSVDARIHEHTVAMISPREMARFLETMLAEDASLRLERLENAGAEPLLDRGSEASEDEAEAAWTGVYKHGFEVVLRGPYLDTIRYLRALESLPWNFFWESLEYEVLEHPDGRARIRAYTLSAGKEWVGA